MNDTDLLYELAPEVERLLERHVSASKEWFPHRLVPWERGVENDPRQPWDAEAHPMDEAVRQALFLNLLTEDNLPYYTSKLDHMFGVDEPWGAWNRRWTAEEARHSVVIRDYLILSGAIDPVVLERARMQQMTHGFHQPIDGAFEGLVYVALQELATRIAHRNTGKLLAATDPAGYEVMARVAADENLHYLFYRDLSTAALALDASNMVVAMERQVREFEMPGTGVEGYRDLARNIARAGIYDLAIHHDHILVPVVIRHWRLESIEGLTPEAEQARERLMERIAKIERVGRRLSAQREEEAARANVA